jgi:hypothetical protein
MRTNTRARGDDGATSSGTERGGTQSISEEDNSDIVKGGPRAEEPLAGAVATESREQGCR